MEHESAIPAELQKDIHDLLYQNDWKIAKGAADRLGKSKDTRAVPFLCKAIEVPTYFLTYGETSVRKEAAHALAKLGDHRAVEPLCALLDDWAAEVTAAAAADALGTLRDRRAVPSLCRALEVRTGMLRIPAELMKTAARALENIGDPSAVGPLLRTLQDIFGVAHEAAGRALVAIGDRSAVQPLCRILYAEGREEVRRIAAETLGGLGYLEALPALQDRARFFGGERRSSVRNAIRKAILGINIARR